jgi:AcrR family transcriptional regulator
MLREKAKASRRRAILTSADKQFARRPYHEVLLEDIAADAEVAKGTLYLYFESKADLYLTLIFESMVPLVQLLKHKVSAAAEKSAWSAMRLLIHELLAFKVEHPALHEAMRETSRAMQEAKCGELKQELAALLEETIRKGVARGEMMDPAPEVTTDLILGAISRAADWMTVKRPKWSAQATAAHLLRIFGDGLLVRRK